MILFVEVKARKTLTDALDSVSLSSQRRIEAAGRDWIAAQDDAHMLSWRNDVIAIVPGRTRAAFRECVVTRSAPRPTSPAMTSRTTRAMSKLNIAVQMDHISTVQITGDSTFALMLEAQARGHTLWHYEVGSLAMRDGVVSARGAPVKVADEEGRHYELADEARRDLSEFDVVLMRQDPPFHMGYITADAPAGAHSSRYVSGQRPGGSAQRARKNLRHRLSRPDAGNADYPRRRH